MFALTPRVVKRVNKGKSFGNLKNLQRCKPELEGGCEMLT